MKPLNMGSLANLLAMVGVDTGTWGTGKAKHVEDLLDEIQKGECRLVIDSSGIHRELDVVGFSVSISGQEDRGIIIESARNRRPSETVKGGEARLACLYRGLSEELRVKGNLSTALREQKVEFSASPSYPNLPSVYNLWEYDVVLHAEYDHLLYDGEFTIIDEGGGQNTFCWKQTAR